jgi:replicative DNA helicase
MLGFSEARDAWNGGDHETAMSLMMGRIEEMSTIRFGTADRGWFFEELGDRQHRRQTAERSAVSHPIGIDKIDRAMDGGLSPGQLEVVMAYSGIGKTFWCVQRGFTTARRRKRCLHFVLEGGRGKTEDRYEARFADSLYREVKTGNLDTKVMAIMQREYRLLKQNLVVRGFGDLDSWRATYDDVLAEVKELRSAHGWVPDLIVVDYGDLLWAGVDGESEYQRQKIAFRQLKALSERIEFRGHTGYAVCSPTQAQRPDKGADRREHVLRPRDVADCYEKVRVSDVIISLNRTEKEKEHALARVYLGKYRDAEDGVCVRVRTAYTKGAFSDLSVKEEPPPPPPEDDF